MIIDFHTHVFPDALAGKVMDKLSESARIQYYTDATEAGLLNSMKKAGVDLSIVLPVVTKPSQHVTINDTAKRLNERYAEQTDMLLQSGKSMDCGPVLISFGGIHPDNENYREILTNLKNSGFKGIKIHPVYQDVNVDDIRFLRLIECASELGLITIMHSGVDLSFTGECCAPHQIKNLLDQVHPRKLVLAHMGGIYYWDRVEELLCNTDVYLDTSFSIVPPRDKYSGKDIKHLSVEQFKRIINKKGIDRILFATDCPWCDQEESIMSIRKNIPAESLDRVFSQNALRLLTEE